jgi:hypothetical protein
MQIQELMNAAFMQATANPTPPRDTALIIFTSQQLLEYTKIIIDMACWTAVKIEGTKLDD